MIQLATYLRALVFVPVVAVMTVVLSFPCVLSGLIGRLDLGMKVVRLWCRVVVNFFSIKIHVVGKENYPNSGALLLFNHQSHFDIPVVMLASTGILRWGAKVELFSIPFFGSALRYTGMLPIARENRNEVINLYQKVATEFRAGSNFILAPEGTRQRTPEIGKFKKGPFHFAITAQVPIVPVVVAGAYDILPKSNLMPGVGRWTHHVVVEFLPAISTQGKSNDDIPAISDAMRADILRHFEKAQFALRAYRVDR